MSGTGGRSRRTAKKVTTNVRSAKEGTQIFRSHSNRVLGVVASFSRIEARCRSQKCSGRSAAAYAEALKPSSASRSRSRCARQSGQDSRCSTASPLAHSSSVRCDCIAFTSGIGVSKFRAPARDETLPFRSPLAGFQQFERYSSPRQTLIRRPFFAAEAEDPTPTRPPPPLRAQATLFPERSAGRQHLVSPSPREPVCARKPGADSYRNRAQDSWRCVAARSARSIRPGSSLDSCRREESTPGLTCRPHPSPGATRAGRDRLDAGAERRSYQNLPGLLYRRAHGTRLRNRQTQSPTPRLLAVLIDDFPSSEFTRDDM